MTFNALQAEINRGNAKFCSLRCAGKSPHQNKPAPTANLECSMCRESFYRPPSKIRGKKSFCSKSCKTEYQWSDNPPINNYKNGSRSYRARAKKYLDEKCGRCGYDEYPAILQVHHIDRNRMNNHISNLEFVCPTCHEVDHYLNNDGRWKNQLRLA